MSELLVEIASLACPGADWAKAQIVDDGEFNTVLILPGHAVVRVAKVPGADVTGQVALMRALDQVLDLPLPRPLAEPGEHAGMCAVSQAYLPGAAFTGTRPLSHA